MILHVSFGVSDPARVACVLADLTGAQVVRAPTPPFPQGAWFVVFGDAYGSLLEVLPATTAFDPDAPLGLRKRPATFEPVATHVLVEARVSTETVHATAAREGWRIQEVETGFFKVLKVWIDGKVLVEFLTKEEAARYAAAFGASGLSSLNGKLRELEVKMTSALSGKVPPEVLSAVLGT
jgi:catechol 2,3-dioxygenase-like lactoylglutathione lyase family enzyme